VSLHRLVVATTHQTGGPVVSVPLPPHPPAVLDFAAAVHLVQVADAAVAAAGRLEEEVEAQFPALRLRAGRHKSHYQVMPHDAENIYATFERASADLKYDKGGADHSTHVVPFARGMPLAHFHDIF
jgi:hypothetical protein